LRYALPGDVVDAEVIDKRKGMLIAKPVLIHQHSPHRTTPFCDHFGVCGGCKWQHMTYEAQLHFKEKTTRDAFSRLGGLDISSMRPIVGATPIRYYRNKLEYTASDMRWLTQEEMQRREEISDTSGI
jgi:23S rRNA (uracil1939-C5)-methyltransferase